MLIVAKWFEVGRQLSVCSFEPVDDSIEASGELSNNNSLDGLLILLTLQYFLFSIGLQFLPYLLHLLHHSLND